MRDNVISVELEPEADASSERLLETVVVREAVTVSVGVGPLLDSDTDIDIVLLVVREIVTSLEKEAVAEMDGSTDMLSVPVCDEEELRLRLPSVRVAL